MQQINDPHNRHRRTAAILIVTTAIATIGFACAMGFVWFDRTPGGESEAATLAAPRLYWIGSAILWLMLSAVWWQFARGKFLRSDLVAATVILSVAFGLGLWIFSFAITLGFIALRDVEAWRVPTWVLVIAALPVYAGVLLEPSWKGQTKRKVE